MNRDFDEMLSALSAAGADFLIVGAHALAAHGRPRATGDLDLWVRPTPQSASRVWKALTAFGAPLAELTEADLSRPGLVFQIGVIPRRMLTWKGGSSLTPAFARRRGGDRGSAARGALVPRACGSFEPRSRKGFGSTPRGRGGRGGLRTRRRSRARSQPPSPLGPAASPWPTSRRSRGPACGPLRSSPGTTARGKGP